MKKLLFVAAALCAFTGAEAYAEVIINPTIEIGEPAYVTPAPIVVAPPVVVAPPPAVIVHPWVSEWDPHHRAHDWRYWQEHGHGHDEHERGHEHDRR